MKLAIVAPALLAVLQITAASGPAPVANAAAPQTPPADATSTGAALPVTSESIVTPKEEITTSLDKKEKTGMWTKVCDAVSCYWKKTFGPAGSVITAPTEVYASEEFPVCFKMEQAHAFKPNQPLKVKAKFYRSKYTRMFSRRKMFDKVYSDLEKIQEIQMEKNYEEIIKNCLQGTQAGNYIAILTAPARIGDYNMNLFKQNFFGKKIGSTKITVTSKNVPSEETATPASVEQTSA